MLRKLFGSQSGPQYSSCQGPEPEHSVEAATAPGKTSRAGWKSPEYAVSRRVQMDPKVLLSNRCVAFTQGNSAEMEQYRVLRTRILHRTGTGSGKTVMITSALPGEGKSLTAINLAFAFAKDYNHTALLVDCDLKRQSIHKILGFASDRGLADHLINGRPLAELVIWPGVEKLTVLSGGEIVGESSELLGSPLMRQLIDEMRDRYPERYVFLDVPPVLAGADAMALAPLVDHILFVVQAGQTPLPEIQKALHLLPKEKIIGLVLNRQSAGQFNPYYSGYLNPFGDGTVGNDSNG